MKELALHILDVAENSIRAEATIIKITIIENIENDLFQILIEDNGKGMDKEMQKKVLDPFVTTRTTRRVGLGLPLFRLAAVQCGGDLIITSEENIGTKVEATFVYSHIDRAPLGNIVDTIVALILTNEENDLEYKHIYGGKEIYFNTKDIKKMIEGVSIIDINVISWIKGYLEDLIKSLLNDESCNNI